MKRIALLLFALAVITLASALSGCHLLDGIRITGFLVGPAYAADQATPAVARPGEMLAIVINNLLIPLIVALVGSIVSVVLVWLKRWLGIKASAETEARIAAAAESVVQMVAEKAANQAKLSDGQWPSGAKQLGDAVDALVARIPKLTPDEADAYIHAALARIPGLGATGDVSYVAR